MSRTGDGHAASPSADETGSISKEAGWRVGTRIGIPGADPFRIAIGDRFVWILQRSARGCSRGSPCSFSRIDPQTNRVVGEPTQLGDAWGLTVGAGSVWVTQFNGQLVRIDERTGQVQARIRAPSGRFGVAIAFGAGSIWTNSYDGPNSPATLVKIDPATNRVTDQVDAETVDARTQSLAFGSGAVWLVDHDHGLVKVEPATLRILAREQLGFGTIGVVATQDAVFLADPLGQRLHVADTRTAHLLRSRSLDVAPIDPALGGGSIWTIDEKAWGGSTGDDRIFRLDPDTLRIVQAVPVGATPASVTFGQGSAWVALRSGEVVRLDD
jgi:hypothetical protein